MEIKVQRLPSAHESTIGDMTIDGVFECYTCEDVVRTGPKVPGKTAIPAGRYKVIVDFSNRFQKRMPLLVDVPGFSGVRIHSGNSAADTEGCLLVGQRAGPDGTVEQSRLAFAHLFAAIDDAFASEEMIYITIVDAKAVAA